MSVSPIPVFPVADLTSTPTQAMMPKPKLQKKTIPSTPNKVIGTKITLQYHGEDGNIYEATTTISSEDYKVSSYALIVDEKHEKKYEKNPDGSRDLIGFEDIGERVLTFKLRYHTRY